MPRVPQPESRLETDWTTMERPENGCAPKLLIQTKLDSFCKGCEKLPPQQKNRCANLEASYSKRLEAAIAAKLLSKSCEYFNFFNKFARISSNFFTSLLCAEFYCDKWIESIWNRALTRQLYSSRRMLWILWMYCISEIISRHLFLCNAASKPSWLALAHKSTISSLKQ